MRLLIDDSLVTRVVLPLLVGALIAYYLITRFNSPKLDAPLEGVFNHGGGVNYAAVNAEAVLKASYPKYRNRFFKILEPHGETLILPAKYLEELKALPNDALSFEKAFSERLMGEFTLMEADRFGNSWRTFPKSIHENLTRNLDSIIPIMQEECKFAVNTLVGSCENWTEVNVFEKLVPIVALVSGRVFVGPELNRDPTYMECVIKYTIEVFMAAGALQQIRPWLRSLYARLGWVPQVNQVWASFKKVRKTMEPLIRKRIEAMEAGEKLPEDLITWNMLNSLPHVQKSIEAQAHSQLIASVAAVHTTSMTGAHILYDLAFRPQYLQSLREEADGLIGKEGKLSKASMAKLRLLDSFFKESQRMNPFQQLSFVRKTTKAIKLHDGTAIPAGMQIAVPTAQRAADAQIFHEPTMFDPWRFSKMRKQPGHESKHQFVSTSVADNSLSFGYGSHVCPGRFFADAELKVIVTHMLTQYDLKMPPGEGRPGNIPVPGGMQPDTSKCLLMRKRG